MGRFFGRHLQAWARSTARSVTSRRSCVRGFQTAMVMLTNQAETIPVEATSSSSCGLGRTTRCNHSQPSLDLVRHFTTSEVLLCIEAQPDQKKKKSEFWIKALTDILGRSEDQSSLS